MEKGFSFFDEAGRVPWVSILSGAVRGAFGGLAHCVAYFMLCRRVYGDLVLSTFLFGIAEILQSKFYLYKELKNFSIGFVTVEGVRPDSYELRWAMHTWKETLGQKIRQIIDFHRAGYKPSPLGGIIKSV